MKKTWIYLLLVLALSLPACKKILDIDRSTTNSTAPVTVEDFDQMLNNPDICDARNYNLIDYPTDDILLDNAASFDPFYLGDLNPWEKHNLGFGDEGDVLYPKFYKWIAQMNLVINNMPVARPEGQFNDKRAVAIAQAKINRAYFYLQLVNVYGAAYQAASAGTDLAVPLILKVDNQVSYPRASIEKVYQQILTDLKDALATPELPDVQPGKNIIRPGRAAALALLARTYLYMGNYTQAEKAASDALAIKSDLQSYLGYGAPASGGRLLSLYEQRNNPEVLLARVSFFPSAQATGLSGVIYGNSEFLNLFDKINDKRYTATYSRQEDPNFPTIIMYRYDFGIRLGGSDGGTYMNYSIGVPEIMLIKAECLARANDAAGAVNLLNTLRVKRILNYTNLSTSVTPDQALRLVLDERRRELTFKGIRLFDLKRLNLDSRFKKDIIRRNNVTNEYMLTFPAGSPNFVFPFSQATLNANPLLVQNPRVQLN